VSASRAAAFLDRDGVLNVDHGYTYKLNDLSLIPGAGAGVRRLNDSGFLVVIVTNQSGIGRGYYSQSDMANFNNLLCDRLHQAGARVDAIYFSPYHPEATIECYRKDHPDRKPGPGMILRACKDLAIELRNSFLIGDKPSDIEAAHAVGVAGYLFDEPNIDDFIIKVLEKREVIGHAK